MRYARSLNKVQPAAHFFRARRVAPTIRLHGRRSVGASL